MTNEAYQGNPRLRNVRIEVGGAARQIMTCWTDAMLAHHEQSKFPPVRGMQPTPDPLAHPFADLEDDLPWVVEGEKK